MYKIAYLFTTVGIQTKNPTDKKAGFLLQIFLEATS